MRTQDAIEVNAFVCELAGQYTLPSDTIADNTEGVERVADWQSGINFCEATLDGFFQGRLCVRAPVMYADSTLVADPRAR